MSSHATTSGRLSHTLAVGLALTLSCTTIAAARDRLQLELTQIELPGIPVSILPSDLNHDGLEDLAIVVAYTYWDQVAFEEEIESDEIEGVIEMLTIVPALADRRELRVLLATPGRGYSRLEPLDLDLSVLAFMPGPPGEPLLALTDEGISAVRLEGSPGQEVAATRVELVPLVATSSILSGTGALLPDLELSADVNGDGLIDVLVPRSRQIDFYLGSETGLRTEPAGHVALPPQVFYQRSAARRTYPLPTLADFDGDGDTDVLFRLSTDWKTFWVARGHGDGRFDPLTAPNGVEPIEAPRRSGATVSIGVSTDGNVSSGEIEDAQDSEEPAEQPIVFFGDLTGDGKAEYALLQDRSTENARARKEFKEAKRPPVRFHIHPSDGDLRRDTAVATSFDATGYALGDESDVPLPGGFQDLDGDGRLDLVTITLDFSILQAVRVLATQSLSLGIDFHVWCQRPDDGSFRAVKGLDLSGKFKFRFNDLRIGQLSQFAGDFDGDGLADFVQMGRGKDVSIHRGRPGCRYPPTPDLEIDLEEAPKNLALVRVDDYDGDERSDLVIIQPGRNESGGESTPARLDLYLSGGA